MTTDPRHDLSQQERDSLRAGINVDALERLLGGVPPEQRGWAMQFFQKGVHAGVVGSSNPETDALIREVWGPNTLPPGVHAHPKGPPRPVFLALTPTLAQPDVGALVIREASGRDVIVLPEEHATAAQLWVARAALEDDRRRNGWTVQTDRSFVVLVARPVPPGPHYERTMWTIERVHGRDLEAVLSADLDEVTGVGCARVVQIEPGGASR